MLLITIDFKTKLFTWILKAYLFNFDVLPFGIVSIFLLQLIRCFTTPHKEIVLLFRGLTMDNAKSFVATQWLLVASFIFRVVEQCANSKVTIQDFNSVEKLA